MKNKIKFLGCIAVMAIVFSFAACDSGGGGGGGGDDGNGDGTGSGTGGDNGGPYSRGDIGPGGGKIFWVSEGGFTVYMVNPEQNYTAHYLEAAPADMPAKLKWASPGYLSTNISGLTNVLLNTPNDFGYGRRNTAYILATDAAAPAAKACNEYNGGGKNDWFLPTERELYIISIFEDDVDNFDTLKTGGYWSSTQGNNTLAWAMNNVGGTSFYNKNSEYAVRAVRAF